ncbi:hypothetical protein LBMAG53_37630 [Planctomycetota bacterium]|nr:hypothetical protein LBMAG53_37630 [Planctomycetota bacterium]
MASTPCPAARFGVIIAILVQMCQIQVLAVEIHVAPSGDDGHPGTVAKPVKTVEVAQRNMRALIKAGLTGPAEVVLHAGTWRVTQPLIFGPEDGSATHRVTWRANRGDEAVISGGVTVPWLVDGADWKAVLPAGVDEPEIIRVGESLAQPSRYPTDSHAYIDIPGVENQGGTKYPANDPNLIQGGWILSAKGDLSGLPAQGPLRLAVRKHWSFARMRANAVEAEAKRIRLEPGFISKKHENLIGGAKNFHAWFEGHPSFTRNPGQWAWDAATRTIIYRPRAGETPTTAPLVVAAAPRLVIIQGTAQQPVRGLVFDGITFRDASGPFPVGGVDDLQANRTFRDWAGNSFISDPALPFEVKTLPVAVLATHAPGVDFTACSFLDLGAHGLAISSGCTGNRIRSCTFTRIGAIPLQIGTVSTQPEGVPLVHEVVAEDNRISQGGLIHSGAVGIWLGFTRASRIERNEISQMPYTGISNGFKWSSDPSGAGGNQILRNHIHQVMQKLCDGGGIYSLGYQPGGRIIGNHIHDIRRAPDVFTSPIAGIYLDNGSLGWTVEGNLVYHIDDRAINLNCPGQLADGKNATTIPADGQITIKGNILMSFKDGTAVQRHQPGLAMQSYGAAAKADMLVAWSENRLIAQKDWSAAAADILATVQAGPKP